MPIREPVTVRTCKHPSYTHVVRWPGPNRSRVAKYFTNETEALGWAKEKRAELGDVGAAFGSISEEERAACTFWRSFVEKEKATTPPPLLTVLREFAETWKDSRSSVTVAAAVEAYEAAKTAEGLRPMSIQSIRTRCGRFADDFSERPVSTITAAEVSDWLLGLESRRSGKRQVSLQAKRNHRLALSGLFNFAKSRGWVKLNPVTDAARPRPPRTRPGILRPADVERLFGALAIEAAELVPFWAVRFFAGVREQEAVRMDWGMVDLAAKEIHLPETVTKTGAARTIRIKPALAAFLEPAADPQGGAIVTPSAMARRYHLAKALKRLRDEDEKAGQDDKRARPFPSPMPRNGARHTFATYHLLRFRHAGETALQLGHGGSPELLHRHYKGIGTAAEAKAFWKIRPRTKPANVIRMAATSDKPQPCRRKAK